MRINTKTISITALMTALTTVATMAISIPIGGTNGFVNVGDSIVFVASILFGPLVGGFAGGVGSALADILLGYAVWAPFTFVIKSIEGILCGLIAHKIFAKKRPIKTFSQSIPNDAFSVQTDKKNNLIATFKQVSITIVATLVAATEMVIGYFFAGWILTSSAQTSFASVPFNCVQAAISLSICYLLLFVVKLPIKYAKLRK